RKHGGVPHGFIRLFRVCSREKMPITRRKESDEYGNAMRNAYPLRPLPHLTISHAMLYGLVSGHRVTAQLSLYRQARYAQSSFGYVLKGLPELDVAHRFQL